MPEAPSVPFQPERHHIKWERLSKQFDWKLRGRSFSVLWMNQITSDHLSSRLIGIQSPSLMANWPDLSGLTMTCILAVIKSGVVAISVGLCGGVGRASVSLFGSGTPPSFQLLAWWQTTLPEQLPPFIFFRVNLLPCWCSLLCSIALFEAPRNIIETLRHFGGPFCWTVVHSKSNSLSNYFNCEIYILCLYTHG